MALSLFLQTQGYTPASPFLNPGLWSQAESTTSIPWICSLQMEDFLIFKILSTKFHNKDVHLPIDIVKCTSVCALCYILLGAIQNYLFFLLLLNIRVFFFYLFHFASQPHCFLHPSSHLFFPPAHPTSTDPNG